MQTSRPIVHRKLHLNHIILSALGSFIAIGCIAYVSVITGYTFLIPPLGATCYIAFVIPDSAFAQPRNMIGGHLLASLVGVLCVCIWGATWWSQAIAVSLIIAGMQLTRMTHPPAAATTLFMVLQGHWDWKMIVTILIGSLVLSMIAIVYNKYILKYHYPHYW